MAVVVFYEKPGCSGNAKQRQILEQAGHTVLARDLTARRWTRGELLSFFIGQPVAAWFNRNSPAVKSGEVVPEALDEGAALDLLEAHPLLIRRPLLEVDGQRRAGFDLADIDSWIGLAGVLVEGDPEACAHDEGHRCEGHDHEH
jgi:nitrogenase-associated protein